MTQPGMPTPPPPPMATPDQRRQALSLAIADAVTKGWRVESASDFSAVLVSGQRPNHVLHAILTISTCLLWGFVWILVAATSKETRSTVIVDEWARTYWR